MKAQALVTVVMTVFFGLAGASGAAEAPNLKQQAEKEVQDIEQKWANALVSRDIAWFDKILADDFHVILPNGQIQNKQEFLEPLKSGALTIESYELLELRVRLYDQTAVVIGRGNVKGQGKKGKFNHEERWTDVYVKKEGRWQCVTAHLTIAKK